MHIDEMKFFHEATLRICGSLEIDTVLANCFDYLKEFIPLNGIQMSIYEPETGGIRSIARASDIGAKNWDSLILLDAKGRRFVEQEPGIVEIVNHPDQSPVAPKILAVMGLSDISHLVLHLKIEGERLGVVVAFAKGFNRYRPEHADMLELLHDPFAIAMSNTLRYREVLRLKDLLNDDNRYLSRELHRISGDEIIGENYGLRDVMEMVGQVAPLNSQVLLLGETGVGKEVIANAIHYSSSRRSGPFIKMNCGAIPEALIDSELFGHEKGAFTGAVSRKRGRFERADKGTIFLDEIGELPPPAQARLLRVLQNREIERVGGIEPIPVDVRIIAATHRNLEEMIRSGQFREDLWFRLNVFPITIPPLRDRRADIPALVNHFIDRKSREMNFQCRPVPAPGAMERLQAHDWPGNVRELENTVERELIRSQTGRPDEPLRFNDFHQQYQSLRSQPPQIKKDAPIPLDTVIRSHIESVLELTEGKVQGKDGAAALLNVNPSTLRNRMRRLEIRFGRKNQ